MTTGQGFTHVIADEAELDAVLKVRSLEARVAKNIAALDDHCRAFIAVSPFLVMATADARGACRATPRGGPPGFAVVLDDHRLVLPDYTGNTRAESHRDLLANPELQLLFFLPGMSETLRVSGTAVLTRAPDLLASLPTGGLKAPALAIGMTVRQAFLQCGKAFRRSHLWDPASWPASSELPNAARILRDHRADGTTEADNQARLDTSYRDGAW
jgi:PPOX class probable FMN-dependent enzyme